MVDDQRDIRSIDQELLERDVIAVEPGLYEEGYGGVRVENLVVVTQDGFRDLDLLPMSLNVDDYL